MQTRRMFLITGMAGFGVGLTGCTAGTATNRFEVTRTEAEWRAILSEAEYLVLREEQTERPYTSALNDEKRAGVYECRGCAQDVYSSEAKYDSMTGWPSFTAALPNAVGTKKDTKLAFYERVEVHCSRCEGHLGHIFDDGPKPTGKRHCLNGLSLNFRPAA